MTCEDAVVATGNTGSANVYITTERLGISGKSVFSCNRFGPSSRSEADNILAMTFCMAKGLEACHQAGIVHCDVKPENIAQTLDGSGWKLLDFGAAGHDGAPLYLGSDGYLSPEIALNQTAHENGTPLSPVSVKSDIYSLGAMLSEAAKILSQTVDLESKEDKTFCREASSQLSALAEQLMTKNPSNRPSIETVLSSPALALCQRCYKNE